MPDPRPTPRELDSGRRDALLRAAGAALLLALMRRDGWAGAASSPGSALATVELKRAAERAELCSAANATGTGLRGEYFAREAGKGEPLLVRLDPTVDFDASLEWPETQANKRPASARWTGWIKPPISGEYRFHLDQPYARLLVSRQLVAGEGAAADAAIALAAGRYYPIALDARRLRDMSGRLRLEWTAPHGARYLVPRALLFLPSDTAKSAGS